jgi:cytochrome c oxidase cbb3-type subunit 2
MITPTNRHVLSALALACAIASSCGNRPAPTLGPAEWDRAAAQASIGEGQRLFLAVCAGCHGADGRARVSAAEVYFPRPRDLTAADYRFRTTASGTLPLRRDLYRTLAAGLPGTAMPAWGNQLDPAELMSLVLYLETLSPRFQDETEAVEEDDILVRPGALARPPVTAERIARGRVVYEQMKCFDCHGSRGRGDGPSAGTTRNQDGSRSHVFDFTYGAYKGGSRPEDIYRTFVTGLDGTPMPSYADSIQDENDRWALVYYVLSLGRQRGAWFYLSERPTWHDPALDP